MVNKETITQKVNSAMNDLLSELMEKEGVSTGDIAPELSLLWDELSEKMAELMFKLIQQNSAYGTIDMMKDMLESKGYTFTEEQLNELHDIYLDCQEWNDDEMLTGHTYDEVLDFVKHSPCVDEVFSKN